MWLVTAVGPVNGQKHFIFPLEQKHTYTFGRDKQSNLCFQSRHIRPKEGVLEVGDWNPADRMIPPKLVWMAEPKKNGSLNPLRSLSLNRGAGLGSLSKDDYDSEEMSGVAELQLDHSQGVDLAGDAWFTVSWSPILFSHERMKDETDELKAIFRKYCVSWTETFDTNDIPDVVIASFLKSTHDCNMAVCLGVPIVTPDWLSRLSTRLKVPWKPAADSEDSFSLPDSADVTLRPPFDSSVPKTRSAINSWLPHPENRELFADWKVIALKHPKRPILDKKYYIAMGAEFDEIDIFSRPLLSPNDFIDRILPSLERAKLAGKHAVVFYPQSTKKDLQQQHVNFDSVIVGACQSQNVFCSSGILLWASVDRRDVMTYLEERRTARDVIALPLPVTIPDTATIVPPATQISTRQPLRTEQATMGTMSGPDIVPSTFPDETDEPFKLPLAVSHVQPQVSDQPGPSRKPLRRRAGREAPKDDLDDELGMLLPASIYMSQPALPSMPQPSQVPDTQLSSESLPSMTQSSHIPDSMMDVDMPATSMLPPSSVPARSRLRRRVGTGATQSSSVLDALDTTIVYDEERKKQETANEIRQLYEDGKRETSHFHAPKRARIDSSSDRAVSEFMNVDGEEEDMVQKTLRTARSSRPTRGVNPNATKAPASHTTPVASPERISEEPGIMEVPPVKRGRASGTDPLMSGKKQTQKGSSKTAPAATQMSTDEAFLQAISKSSKSKKAIDELDKEFNQLRIPKPGGKSVVINANIWDSNHPDYTIVNDFTDELRGNFIEIVRKDLFRKDTGRKQVAMVAIDEGKPNFKKFKKKSIVRREPVPLVLAAQSVHSAEMGKPYWKTNEGPSQSLGSQVPTLSSRRPVTFSMDDEDEAPLLPKSRRRLLEHIQEEQDDDNNDITLVAPPTRRGGATPLTQATTLTHPTRRTRAESAGSEVSGAGAGASASSVLAPTARPRATALSRRKTSATIVADSDDDDDGPLFRTAPSASETSMRGGARTTVNERLSTSARSSTLDLNGGVYGSSRSTRSTPTTVPGTARRRKLLIDDDDEDDGEMTQFRGVQKKRRLG